MRRALSTIFSVALTALTATGLSAQETSHVPVKRLIYSKDLDFYGSDLTNLFDTTREACERACLANEACVAFTFNQRSNACFPKGAVSDKQVYEGALSAEVYTTSNSAIALSQTRGKELGFLRSADLENARKQARDLGHLHPGGQWSVDVLLKAADDRRREGNTRSAMHWTGAAAAQSDRSDHWLAYARLAFENSDKKTRRKMDRRALLASINAYLRASSPVEQADALDHMAQMLERAGRGRDMIPALRLAETLSTNSALKAALDKAIGKYGFRIVKHRVEKDLSEPRICAEFSEPLVKSGLDYTPYLRLPSPALAVEASGRELCVAGLSHGARYTVTFRAGLPAGNGENLLKDVPLTLYVGDRTPEVRFPGRAYVLPKSAEAALPLVTVNLETADLLLRRVSDRNLLRVMQGRFFGQNLDKFQDDRFEGEIGEEIWTGTAELQQALNRDMTTRLPMGDVIADLPAGLYALTARVPGRDIYDDAGVTQWFVLSDLGLSTLKGADGVHVTARALSTAEALEGVQITLLSRSNRVLGEARTDAQGYAHFGAGLANGTGSAAPALITATLGDHADMAFVSLTEPAFDLSDRGVEGRAPAGPIDLFLATDRGAYRAGETIHATALARDDKAQAITDLPITAILTRPDGVEYSRTLSSRDHAGGHVFALPLGQTVPRGTWTLEMKADLEAPALALQKLLVEDFLPERIDFDLSLPETPIRVGDTPPLSIEARYLFGAPGADLPIEAQVSLRPIKTLEGYTGYRFGRHDAPVERRTRYVSNAPRTDAQGRARVGLSLPEITTTGAPLEMVATVQVSEGSGRPVERQIKRALASSEPMIGIKPRFEDVVAEGSEAGFDLLAIGPDQQPRPMRVRWTLNRVETRYQWYQLYGDWSWEPVTTRKRISSEEVMLSPQALSLDLPVDWGTYELVVERLDGPYAASSVEFHAGWYAPADTSTTPDMLELSLDKPSYRSGETAQLRLVPRDAGTALITVMSNRVIHREAVEVTPGETLIPLNVTEDWGTGAYVTASVLRPMDRAAEQSPARALGLSYAKIDPSEKQLTLEIESVESTAPRKPFTARVKVEGTQPGQPAFVTLAAVDLGILNLTGFETPDPSAHYFGQHRLGMEMRDLYGRLIDGMSGEMGKLRSGGDAASSMRLQSPPPTQDLVAYYSGAVPVGPDGYAEVTLDLPAFNGTLRLMAMGWSESGVGQAERDVLVRDPVVVTASLPRFLAPGDSSSALLEITHASGPSGQMALQVSAAGVALDAASLPATITLGDQQSQALRVPLIAGQPGDHSLRVAVTTPDGQVLEQVLTLPVRANDPTTGDLRRVTLAAGDTLELNPAIFADFQSGTGTATVSAGPLARLKTAQLMQSLERYPYGCTEQLTSKAMPLLYLDHVAEAMGLTLKDKAAQHIETAIAQVLTRQSSSGAFGMWRAASGNLWLDAYVSDFLSRAKAQGHSVPELAFRQAMDNLRNRVNYAADFDEGGEEIAYALLVLAREGAASMGDLRYYVDVKGDAFSTPMAAAQLGAALAAYGDQPRSDVMFARAARMIARQQSDKDSRVWRSDYGSVLRDTAGVLSLAREAGSQTVNQEALLDSIASTSRGFSTQEAAWTLLAAHALVKDPNASGLAVNGAPLEGPLLRAFDGGTPLEITNVSARDVEITLARRGTPLTAPEPDGYGYKITRAYYQMDGTPVPELTLTRGERLVTVLTVTPFEDTRARLMINDPLPAGLEIDNPNLLRGGDLRALSWLKPPSAEFSEFRSDRFLAAVDWTGPKQFQLAYIVRAVSAGNYHHPAASVEDMYNPQYRAHGATGRMSVSE